MHGRYSLLDCDESSLQRCDYLSLPVTDRSLIRLNYSKCRLDRKVAAVRRIPSRMCVMRSPIQSKHLLTETRHSPDLKARNEIFSADL